MPSPMPTLGDLALPPVSSRRTMQDEVYERLSHALMAGRLEPGQQLTISSIADMCRTSHMPVREALRRLAAESALDIASSGSAYVPAISLDRLDDLCDARVINESEAGSRAAKSANAELIRQMEGLIAEYYSAAREHDLAGMTRKNQEFHFAIYRMSRSPVLIRIIETLWLQFGPFLRKLTRNVEPSLQPFAPDIYTKHHYDILNAFRQRDAVTAKKAIAADINATRTLLKRLCGAEERQTKESEKRRRAQT